MGTPHDSSDRKSPPAATLDGFSVLDECHRETLVALDQLEALVARLGAGGVDAEARALAVDVHHHFSTTARQHHEDEERHVFPKLAASLDEDMVQAVLRLQQDHRWLEEDWLEIAPHVDAVACGQTWYDVDVLREGVEIFVGLSRDHIALEESWLYPDLRARLRPGERREMGREMAARRRAERRATDAR